MAVQEVGTFGSLEFGGYAFSNQDFFSCPVDQAASGHVVEARVKDTLGRFKSHVWRTNVSSTNVLFRHVYESSGDFTYRLVFSPDAQGITEFLLVGDWDKTGSHPAIRPDVSTLLSKLVSCELLRLQVCVPEGEPSATELGGLRIIRLKNSFSNSFNSNSPVSLKKGRLPSTIEKITGKASKGGLTGDWANVGSGDLSNLVVLDFVGGQHVNTGTIGEFFEAAPNIETLGVDNFIENFAASDLQSGSGTRSLVDLRVDGAHCVVNGTLSSLDDSSLSNLLYHEYRLQGDLYGDLGNLPSWTRSFYANRGLGKTNDNKLIFDAYDPGGFDDFDYMIIEEPRSDYVDGDVYVASLANGGSHLNGDNGGTSYSDGAEITLFGADSSVTNASDSWYDWPLNQRDYRAVAVKPNVTIGYNSNIDTSHWNADWAVADVTGYPDTSTIDVEDPNNDGAGDTDASSTVPTDGTLSGAKLYVYEDSQNETGPDAAGNGRTEYLISGVTDNGDGTFTIALDTTNGPSLSDATSDGSFTRIAFTW